MSQSISTTFHALNTSQLQNRRFKNILRDGVYAGFFIRPNPGAANFLDITAGDDGTSVLITSEGVRIEEDATLPAILMVDSASVGLTRIDLVVCTYQYTTDSTVVAAYSVIKGQNQVTSGADPIKPTVQNEFQIPLAYVTVNPQQSGAGTLAANIAQSDIRQVPKAAWTAAPDDLAGLKPIIVPEDRRLLFVYSGIMPSVDGKRVIEFSGGYSDAIDPTTLTDGTAYYYLFGITDEGEVALVGGAATQAALPDLSSDVVPVAIVQARKTTGAILFESLLDIRFPYSRRLADPAETDAYTDLLADSVFSYLRVERFVDDDSIDVDSIQLEVSGTDPLLTAEVDSKATALSITWAGTTPVPSESVTIVTGDLLLGSTIAKITHFMVTADTAISGLQFQYSTSSANSGFTTTKYSLNEIERIPLSGARKLYLKFVVPPDGFSSGVAQVFSYGVLINLDNSIPNTISLTELGISELGKSVQNLIANGDFYYWSQDDTDGNKPDLASQDTLTFSLSSTNDDVLLADGWQMTSFTVPAVGEMVERIILSTSDNSSNTALRYKGAVNSTASGGSSVAEYRIPRSAELLGQHITFAIEYTTSAAASLGIGIAQYTRTDTGVVLKTKDEQFTSGTSGEVVVNTTTTIGPDVEQIGLYLIFLDIATDTEHVINHARAAVGTYASLPYSMVMPASSVLRQYYERGRVYLATTTDEGAQVGVSSHFGSRKATELGTLVVQTTTATDSNRSTNVGELLYSEDEHGLVVLAEAASTGFTVVDVDWEAYVRYEGNIQ
jgi:hypothetical protein